MKIATFPRKNGDLPKRVVDFPRERDTFRNKIMEIVEDFDEKSYNNNGKTLEIVEDFACEAKFLHFFIVHVFFFLFLFFLFFFFFFLFFFVGSSNSDFSFGLQFRHNFSSHFFQKIQFFGPSPEVPFEAFFFCLDLVLLFFLFLFLFRSFCYDVIDDRTPFQCAPTLSQRSTRVRVKSQKLRTG